MEATATPRVTSSYLNSYVGKNVIVVGKVVQLRGDEATLDADGNIAAHLNRVSAPCCYPTSTTAVGRAAILTQASLRNTRMHTSRQETACRLSEK